MPKLVALEFFKIFNVKDDIFTHIVSLANHCHKKKAEEDLYRETQLSGRKYKPYTSLSFDLCALLNTEKRMII
jgi:5-methylcytosine-specific restriction endonuclease McrA